MNIVHTDLPERFWSKVDKTDSCWLWMGARTGAGGYGNFWHENRVKRSHRLAYIDAIGPIPAGLEIDHLCRVRHCVNPDHLEPVTRQVNIKRGILPTLAKARIPELHAINRARTHCKHGHEFTSENTGVRPDGKRRCRPCDASRMREYRKRAKARN